MAIDDLATHWAVLFSTKLDLCEICDLYLHALYVLVDAAFAEFVQTATS